MTPNSAAVPARTRRLRRVLLCLLTVTASALALTFSAAGPAGADADPSAPAPIVAKPAATGPSYAQGTTAKDAQAATVHYAVPKQVCAPPTKGRATCMAVKLVPATKTTKGAKAFVIPAARTGRLGGFSPADLAKAYAYNRTAAKAATQTVAIVDAYDSPSVLADLNAFNTQYKLPTETVTSFRKVNQLGNPAPLPAANTGWSVEISLDVQAVRAVCALCKILLVEADSDSSDDLAAAVNTAVNLGATEISNSYGAPEDSGAAATIKDAYSHPGVVITAATGDDGWYDWDFAMDPGGSSDGAAFVPSTYPDVVAVGGTTLTPSALTGARHSETVWNANGASAQVGLANGSQGASGGGCSFLYPAHSWQSQVAGYSTTGCGSKRLAADISADADPVTGFDVVVAGAWQRVGGTSLSSPLIAAMWALAGGSGANTYPAQSLYHNVHSHPTAVYDVTVGGNSFCGGATHTQCTAAVKALTAPNPTGNPNNLADQNGNWLGLLDCGYNYSGLEKSTTNDRQCNARTGYDGPSGLGAPTGLSVFTPSPTTVSITAPVMNLNALETFKAAGYNNPTGATPVTYNWTWGDGKTTPAGGATATHTYTAKGTYSVGLTVIDSNGHAASTSRSITVGMPPVPRITGNSTLHVNTYGKWSSSTTTDPNTGGTITQRAWKFGINTYSRNVTFTYRFPTVGTRTLILVVIDNAGLRVQTTKTITVIK
jgi:PKD domain-containing protein